MGNSFLVQQVNGSGTIDYTFAPAGPVEIRSVRVHLSVAGGSGNFVLSQDSATSTSYDVQFKSQDMSSLANYVWPDSARPLPVYIHEDDKFEVDWTSPITTTTYGVEIIYRLL